MACPICKSTGTHDSILIKDYEYNTKHITQYYVCSNCDGIYRNKILNYNIEKSLYDKKSYRPVKGGIIYDLLKNINSYYEKIFILKYLKKYKIKNPTKIIDMACGKGYLIDKFAKNLNFKCFGIDINVDTENNTNNINFIQSSYTNLDFIKNIKPNLIIINNFIEHMEDHSFINNILDVMENKSLLIIITPNTNTNGKKYFKDCWSGFHAPRHKVIFNERNIQNILKSKNNYQTEIKFLYDPFTNLISTVNLFKKLKNDLSFITLIKILISPFILFLDLINKNRIMMVIRKK